MKRLDHYFPQGDMYRLIPSLSKVVFPGEKVEMTLKGHLESDIVAALRCPAVVNSYAFYVPFRLVFSSWPDFIADADTAIALPFINTTTFPFPEIAEPAGFNGPISFYRRSFKLCYNEYFGDLHYGTAANYTDPLNDGAQNTVLPLKTVNQLLGALALDVDEPADNYTVAASTIELTEFRRRLKQNARQNNQRIGGEKYADALRRFGVDMREELASRPEMIYRSSEIVYPQEVYNTSDIGTGSRVGRYRVALNCKTKRKFCMEHGYVFFVHAIRPFLARSRPPLDRNLGGRHWFMEEPEKAFREVASNLVGTNADVEPDPLIPASMWNNLGDMQIINGGTGALQYNASAALSDLVYPTVLGTPKVNLAVSAETLSLR